VTDDSGLHIVAVQEGGNLLSGGGARVAWTEAGRVARSPSEARAA
jgi:hypothetical protein